MMVQYSILHYNSWVGVTRCSRYNRSIIVRGFSFYKIYYLIYHAYDRQTLTKIDDVVCDKKYADIEIGFNLLFYALINDNNITAITYQIT